MPPNSMKTSTWTSSVLLPVQGTAPMHAKSQDKHKPPVKPPAVLSLGQLLEYSPTSSPALIEPGLLPYSGILFVAGEPKVGKAILVANLALAVASGCSRAGFQVPTAKRVLICQFELPV